MEEFDIILFEENYHNGECRLEVEGNIITMSEWEDCYETLIEPASEYVMVCTQKLFYNDTFTLMREGNYLKLGGTKIGIWKEYDREGSLINEIDYDKDWGACWNDLLKQLALNEINLKTVVRISRCVEVEENDEIKEYESADFIEDNRREMYDGNAILRHWKITVLLSPMVKQVYYFDGETGNKLWSEFLFKEN